MTRRVAFVMLLLAAAVTVFVGRQAAAETVSVVLLPGVFGERANMGGHETIFAITAKVVSPFAGPLLGMFLLGMLSRRANSFGVMAGAVVGAGATVAVTYGTAVHWLWYFVVGTASACVAGFALSHLRPAPTPGQLDR